MSRSYLFIPGDVPRMLQNLEVFDADAVIIDFEDGVNSDKKDEARNLAQTFLTQFNYRHPKVYVRINPVSDADNFRKDLTAIKSLNIEGIVLPKVTMDALERLDSIYQKENFAFSVVGLVETPQAFFELEAIARHPHTKALMFGREDLLSSLNATKMKDDLNLLYGKSALIFAAKAYGKEVIDAPCVTIDNDALMIEEIDHAVAMGFSGKAAIHPNQVESINAGFYPNATALLEAQRIIEQSEKAHAVRFALDGKMIDKPIIDRAKALLEKAKAYDKVREQR